MVMSRISEIRKCRTNIETVEAAIEQVEKHGQSMQVDGVVYTRATVFRLYERLDRLRQRLGRLNGSRRLSSGAILGGPYS